MSASSSSLSTAAPQARTSTTVHLPPLVSAKKQLKISAPETRTKRIFASQEFQKLPAIALEAIAYYKRKAETAKKKLDESQKTLFATQLTMENLNRIIEKQKSEIEYLQSSLNSISATNIEKVMAQIKREPTEFKS